MSVSGVGSSPALQWLQDSLTSRAGSAAGGQSSCGAQSSPDTTSISQQALQLNAAQASQTVDPSQASGVAGAQGHHHHHHRHGGGQGAGGQGGNSFVDQLAQSIVTDLQKATGSDTASGSAATTAQAGGNGGSFIDKLASAIANDLLAKYQASGSNGTIASTVNAVA